MRLIRIVLWLVALAVTLVFASLYFMGHYDVSERLTSVFWAIQLRLPVIVSFEQFLVAMTIASLLLTCLVIGGCVVVFTILGARSAVIYQQGLSQAGIAKKEVAHVKDQHRREYEQILQFGKVLTKQLDKRVIVQTLLETASRVTSGSQANSVAAFWLFHPETETFRFEIGLYCDETLFTKTEFTVAEQPFAHAIAQPEPWILPAWDGVPSFVNRPKAARVGSATGLMMVPLVIEGRVAAILSLFCHPDIIKSYEEQKVFYQTIWAELTLGAVIAIQGAVTILDRLTLVHTREYFMTRLIQEIERANRYQLPLSLLMIDIDNFKLVNDTLGHPKGDAVLKIIAKLIKKEVRAIDLVGRYGGEEFIVMLPETGYGKDTTQAIGALVVAERIRKGVDNEFRGLQKPLDLTISIGVAVRRFPEDRDIGYSDLVRMADEQLYRAKTTGKNKVCSLLPETPEAVV